jgi:hypothetical protein
MEVALPGKGSRAPRLADRDRSNSAACRSRRRWRDHTNMDLACRIQASAYAAASIIRDAFSPIMMEGALVLPEVSVGMMEASATRSP